MILLLVCLTCLFRCLWAVGLVARRMCPLQGSTPSETNLPEKPLCHWSWSFILSLATHSFIVHFFAWLTVAFPLFLLMMSGCFLYEYLAPLVFHFIIKHFLHSMLLALVLVLFTSLLSTRICHSIVSQFSCKFLLPFPSVFFQLSSVDSLMFEEEEWLNGWMDGWSKEWGKKYLKTIFLCPSNNAWLQINQPDEWLARLALMFGCLFIWILLPMPKRPFVLAFPLIHYWTGNKCFYSTQKTWATPVQFQLFSPPANL